MNCELITLTLLLVFVGGRESRLVATGNNMRGKCEHNKHIWSKIDNNYYYRDYYLKLNFGTIHVNSTNNQRTTLQRSFAQYIVGPYCNRRKNFPPLLLLLVSLNSEWGRGFCRIWKHLLANCKIILISRY